MPFGQELLLDTAVDKPAEQLGEAQDSKQSEAKVQSLPQNALWVLLIIMNVDD